MSPGYDFDEFAEVMVTIDGQKYGTNANDYVADLIADDNEAGNYTTGWQTAKISLGKLTAGKHTLVVGAYNNKKTYQDEITTVLIDNIAILQNN